MTVNTLKVPGSVRLIAPFRHAGASRWAVAAFFVAVLTGLFAAAGDTARAQSPSVEIVSSSAVSKLPDGIEFKLRATGDVAEVSVRFTINGRRATQYDYLDFDEESLTVPGGAADATLFYRTDTRARYLPPGVVMRYRFEVMDSNGDVYETEPEDMVVTDSRFEWDTVSRDGITIYFHGPVTTRANALLDASLTTISNMSPVLGIPEHGAPINVTMFNNIAEMIDATAARSGAISRELITEGQAFSEENAVIVLGNSNRATGTMSHELTHVLISRAVTGARAAMPTWLNEGLAEFGNIDPGVSYQRYLEWAIDTERIAPLTSLDSFPGDPDLVIVSYGQSRDVVKFMVDTFGPDQMARFLAEYNVTRRIDQAMQTVYGFDRRGLDTLWRDSVGASPLQEIRLAPTPTPAPMPTYAPYTLDSISTSPTSTPAPAATPAQAATPAPVATPAPSDATGSSGGGGCGAATPGAPVEGGFGLLLLAVGSAAGLRSVRAARRR